MSVSISRVYIVVFVGIFLTCSSLNAQICDNKYLSLIYHGSTFDTFSRSVATNNEIIAIGGLFDYNSAGHIAKFSANGTPLWSHLYSIDYYSFYPPTFFKTVYFKDIIGTADGGYLVAGSFDQVISPFGNPPPVKKFALLAKIDKFGKVVWNKALRNEGDLGFSTVYETSDGDYIAYLTTDNGTKRSLGDHSYGKVLRLDSRGTIKWSTQLFTFLYDAGGLGLDFKHGITQARNKNIIIGQVVHKTELPLSGTNFRILPGNLHFLELDYTTGKVNWETSYQYPVPPSDPLFTADIVNITELPDGRFSFITSLYLSTTDQPSLTKRGAEIITSDKGKIERVIAYYPSVADNCNIVEAVSENNGNRVLLFKNGNKSVLTSISNTSQINWSRGYNNGGGSFPTNCFSAGNKGYNIFGSNNALKDFRLLITDVNGEIECANESATMLKQEVPFDVPHDSVVTSTTMNFDDYRDFGYPLKRMEPYPIVKTIDCQQVIACCTDVVDSTHDSDINICEGSSYMLPDSSVITDSGTYYVTFKTPLGCDSIKYYRVAVDKDIAKLTLGNDTCLIVPGSITLKATPGYNEYYWGTNPIATNEEHTISQPGNYTVTVTNSCGTKSDTITIYDQCDYATYMPKAFTPNNDNLNDYFRVSPLNKNRLISLRVFTRWGQLVFQTTNQLQGWDGTFHNEPLPSGTYVFYLEMEGFTGKRITEKGTFLLIR